MCKETFIRVITTSEAIARTIFFCPDVLEALQNKEGLCGIGGNPHNFSRDDEVISISFITKPYLLAAEALLIHARTNPKHYVVLEEGIEVYGVTMGSKALTPSGKATFKVVNFDEITPQFIVELTNFMREEFPAEACRACITCSCS